MSACVDQALLQVTLRIPREPQEITMTFQELPLISQFALDKLIRRFAQYRLS